MEQPVLELGSLHLDMLGELEAALERAAGNALVKDVLALRLVALFALARNGEHAVVQLHIQVLLGEPGHRNADAVMGLVGTFDVIGRVAVAGIVLRNLVQHVEQPVEADGRTEKRGKIESHGHNLLRSDVVWSLAPSGPEAVSMPGCRLATPAPPQVGRGIWQFKTLSDRAGHTS